MVDLSLIVDVSGSIGSAWSTVAAATRGFIDGFDSCARSDVVDDIQQWRVGSLPDAFQSWIRQGHDQGRRSRLTARRQHEHGRRFVAGYDELRSVTAPNQSSLRVIVLFTDGASNGVPGQYTVGARRGH